MKKFVGYLVAFFTALLFTVPVDTLARFLRNEQQIPDLLKAISVSIQGKNSLSLILTLHTKPFETKMI